MKDLTLPTLEKVIAEKSASAKRGQKEAAVAFVTYDGAAADLNELARYVDRLENAARAALSHHEDAGQADVGGLGGEKGEAVAWRFRWHPEGDWHLTEKEPRGGDGTTKQPLFAAPVGKARMLTDEEADHITGMHNTGRSQGDSECAEAIQRKFCEVNGIRLAGGNKGYV